MEAKNKRNILIIAVMSIVVILTLLGFITFSYVRNYADLPTAFNSLTSYGGPFFALNPNQAQISIQNNSTITAIPTDSGARKVCSNFFDAYGRDFTGSTYIGGDDPYQIYNSYHLSSEDIKHIYNNYTSDTANTFNNGVIIVDGYNNYPTDSELKDKLIMSFIWGNCRFDINLKELGIKYAGILGDVYFDKSIDSVIFTTTEGIGNYPAQEDEPSPKSAVKVYLYNVKTNKAIVKEVPFNKAILGDSKKSDFYIITEDKLLNLRDKVIYLTVNYVSSIDGCGYECWESLSELKGLNLKEINSNTGVYAFNYDNSKLEKIYDAVFYNPADGSLFTGGELNTSFINGVKLWYKEKREIHNYLAK